MSFNEPILSKREAPGCIAKGIGFCIPLGVLFGEENFLKIFAGGLLRFNVLEILHEATCLGTHSTIVIGFNE